MKTLKIFLVLFFLSCASTVIASGTGGPPQLFRIEKKESHKNLRKDEAYKNRTIFFLIENPVLEWIQPFKQEIIVEDGQTKLQRYKIWPRIKLYPAGKYGLGALGLGTLFGGLYCYFNWYKK